MPTIRTEEELLELLADQRPITAADMRDFLVSCRVDAIDTAGLENVESDIQDQFNGLESSLNSKQPLDATLTALASYNTNGILTQTAADTFTGRTITGTTNRINVTNGDGISGNPTISAPQDIHTSATPTFSGMTLSGLTANRALITGTGGLITTSTVTSTQIGYLANTHTDIQSQINGKISPNNYEFLNLGTNISNSSNGSLIIGEGIDCLATGRGVVIIGSAEIGDNGTAQFGGNGGDGGYGSLTVVAQGLIIGVAKGGTGGDASVIPGTQSEIIWSFLDGESDPMTGGVYYIHIAASQYGPFAWNETPSTDFWTWNGSPAAYTLSGLANNAGQQLEPTLDIAFEVDTGSEIIEWGGSYNTNFTGGYEDTPVDGENGGNSSIEVSVNGFAGGYAQGCVGTDLVDCSIVAHEQGAIAFGVCLADSADAFIQAEEACVALGWVSNGEIIAGNEHGAGVGALAFGKVTTGGAIRATGNGSFAGGICDGSGASVFSSSPGSFAFGLSNGGTIQAGNSGAVAFGYANPSIQITANGIGAFAGGYGLNRILASGAGSFAFGRSQGISTRYLTSSGNGSIAMGYADGWGFTASGNGAIAMGHAANADLVASAAGAFIHGWGGTANQPAEYQHGLNSSTCYRRFLLSGTTNNDTPTNIYIFGTTPPVMPNDTTWGFTITVVARRTDADGESAHYILNGCIDRNSSAATTALVGAVDKTVIAEDSSGWDVNVTADTSNGGITVTVTGESGKTIRWSAVVCVCQATG
jgi:hypothetical protein